MLEEGKDDFRRIRNDNNVKYDNDELLINLLYINLQPNNKGYYNKDYSNEDYID